MRENSFSRFIAELVYKGLESFGRYYSSYRGIVTNNSDPLFMGRVKLIIPEIAGTEEYETWAIPKGIFAGSGYGMQLIPRITELVWVEFESGFPERPMYNLGYFGKDEVIKDPLLNDVNNFWFRSPLGHTVQVNDTKKLINIKSAGGYELEINEKGISLISGKISLGQLNRSSQPAVLGDKTEEVLNDIQSILLELSQAITADVALSANQPFLMRANLTKSVPSLLRKVTALKSKISTIKSKKITLD